MPEKFVDFQLVKRSVPMESALGHYNIQLRRVGNSLRGKCPLPTHTSAASTESFGVDTEKNIWACQSNSCVSARSGKKGGNVLDFVSIMEDVSIRDAAILLSENFSLAKTSSTPQKGSGKSEKSSPKQSARDEREFVNKPLSFTLKEVDPTHPYLRHRGITTETAKTFGVGFFPGKGSMSGRVVIPIHNERGELVAYAGRSIDNSEPKYKLPEGFRKSEVLFNLHRVLADTKSRDEIVDTVIVVEGFFDCMKVWQSGLRNVVSLMGSSLSEFQANALRRFRSVMLVLDGDEAGRRGTEEIGRRLVQQRFVRVVDVGEGRQPDQLGSDEIRDLLKQ